MHVTPDHVDVFILKKQHAVKNVRWQLNDTKISAIVYLLLFITSQMYYDT